MNPWLRSLAIGFATLGPVATITPEARAGAPVTIEIDRFQFGPREITIDVGAVVEWVNRDQTVHSIVSAQAGIASPGLDTGDQFSFSFQREGDYEYLCGLHPHMTGLIHVRPIADPR